MSHVLSSAALDVATAEEAVRGTGAVLEAAETARTPLAARLTELGAERSAMAARRASGDCQVDDAGRVALIDMDAAGVAALLSDADQTVKAARIEHEQATAELVNARRHLAEAEATVQAAAFAEHAGLLIGMLGETLDRQVDALARLDADGRGGVMSAFTSNIDQLAGVLLKQILGARGLARACRPLPAWKPSEALHQAIARQAYQNGQF